MKRIFKFLTSLLLILFRLIFNSITFILVGWVILVITLGWLSTLGILLLFIGNNMQVQSLIKIKPFKGFSNQN